MEQKKKMGGSKCAIKNCLNKYSNTNGVSYFTLPRDLKRRAIWIENCRLCELPNTSKFVSHYRICQDHFENKMFLNINQKNRLTYFAVPTLFNDETLTKRVDIENSNDSKSNLNIKLLNNFDEVLIKKEDIEIIDDKNSINKLIPLDEMVTNSTNHDIKINDNSSLNTTIYGNMSIKTSNSSSQTSLTCHEINAREQLKYAKKRIKDLELKVKKLNKSLIPKDSVKYFLNYCQKMLPSNLNCIIEAHFMCEKRKKKGFRYSKEMKEFALSIYFLSPKTYHFLKTKFSLPDIRTLKRMTSKIEFLHIKNKFKKFKPPTSIKPNNYKLNNKKKHFASRNPTDFQTSNTEIVTNCSLPIQK